MDITNQQLEWNYKVRNAWRQVHEKVQNHGHLTKHCPWTWNEFRDWFKDTYEQGVNLKIHELNQGHWPEVLKSCRRGMMLPIKAPF
jgi:hypothetical protein